MAALSDASSDAAVDARLREALFAPRCIALVGASADISKNNSRPQRFLRQHGYTGSILPINPGRTEIFGERAYPELKQAPGPIDHAFIMVPAAAVPEVVQQCCELKIPVATIFSAGFAELGGAGLARAQARGRGFSKLVSVGNECDLGVGEIAEMLVDDADTGAILLFLEAFRDAPRLARAAHRESKPLAVFLAPRADQGLVLLEANGIAGFRTPESCADAVNAYLNWSVPGPQAGHARRDLAAAAALVARSRGARLNESDSCRLFAALGINVAESRVLTHAADCADITGPVAVKILSADIPHKTDFGMVRLNIPVASVRHEAEQMLEDARTKFPAAQIDGVLVQRMEHGIAEVIVGYRRDPEVGPVVLLGAGGTAAELRRSFCVRIAPVSVAQAEAMIDEVRDLAVLRGYRNLPRADCAALANSIRALSLLALLDASAVSEAEINPLIVKGEGEGVVAVDGLVVFADRPCNGVS